jgi:hypothetical protein
LSPAKNLKVRIFDRYVFRGVLVGWEDPALKPVCRQCGAKKKPEWHEFLDVEGRHGVLFCSETCAKRFFVDAKLKEGA